MRAAIVLLLAFVAFASAQSVDWRTKGVVPPVTNQGQSGDVVSVVATELVESVDAVASGKLVLGSPDQVLQAICVLHYYECSFWIAIAWISLIEGPGLRRSGPLGCSAEFPFKRKCAFKRHNASQASRS